MLTLDDALSTLEKSPELPSIDTLVHILQRCRKLQSEACTKRVHFLIHNSGLEAHLAVGNHLVPVLVDCKCVPTAQQVFNRLPKRNEHSWTSLIQGYSECADSCNYALHLFHGMQEDSVDATSYTFLALIKNCMQYSQAGKGLQLHEEIAKEGLESDPYVGSALVDMYARFGFLLEAEDVFDGLEARDVILWTSMLTQYVEQGFPEKALDCLAKLQHDGVDMDAVVYACILKACGSIGALEKGREIHSLSAEEGFEGDPFVGNSLVDMYSKCDCLSESQEVLEEMPSRDVVSWNTLIAGYAGLGLGKEVLNSLERMRMEGLTPSSVTFICSFQAFGIVKDWENVQAMHMQIAKEGIEGDITIGNSLVDTYLKCGLLMEAKAVFESLSVRDVVSWTALLQGFSEHGLHDDALNCLEQMQYEDVSMDGVTLICILKACASMGAIDDGLKLHAHVTKEGFEMDPMIGNTLVDMYAKCKFFNEAEKTFDSLQCQTVVSWNVLLEGYAEQGWGEESLDLLEELKLRKVCPNSVTYVSGLKACGNIQDLGIGQSLHAEITKKGFDSELLVGGALVDVYAKCGSLVEADKVFEALPQPNEVAWASLLAGYVEHGLCLEAVECVEHMKLGVVVSPNALIYVYCLRACGKLRALDKGQKLHADIAIEDFEGDQLVGITLVSMYARCGSSAEAQEIFDLLDARNIASWNLLITGLADSGLYMAVLENAAQMKCEGVVPDAVTFICCLKACSQTDLHSLGQSLHDEIIKDSFEEEPFVCAALMGMYARFGALCDVEEVFNEMPAKTVLMWNTLLTGYFENGFAEHVLECLDSMQTSGICANGGTYVACLRACSKLGDVGRGQQLHTELIKEGYDSDPLVSHALLDLYSKCGFFEEARDVFARGPLRGTVLWNTLLTGYTKHGCSEEALELLERMDAEDVPPDVVTLICSLKACSNIGYVDKCRELHAIIVREEFDTESIVGNTLVDMYAKCGLLVEAQDMFDELVVRDVVSWSALITGYACQGAEMPALNLFQTMKEEGIQPDEVTYLRLLSACSHAGHVEMGQKFFKSIWEESGSVVTAEQCNCMMDLLSRAGQVDEAVAMTEKIPCAPDMVTWTTMLGACNKYGHVELGRQAFEGVARLDRKEAASFVLMSNIYAC